jgi:uncharacterized protein HemX
MNPLDYAEYGVAIFAVAMLGFVVYLFIRREDRRDENQAKKDTQFLSFMEKQELSFKNTIDNHLDEQKKAMESLTAVTDKQNQVSEELLDYLKKCNEGKK